MPDQVTTNWWKEERGERIFVDFNQANRDRTMAGAYSPRALPGATVSTPVAWDELDGLDPTAFTVRSIPKRLQEVGDPWAAMQDAPGRIDTLLEWWERDRRTGWESFPSRRSSQDARRAPTRAAEQEGGGELGRRRRPGGRTDVPRLRTAQLRTSARS